MGLVKSLIALYQKTATRLPEDIIKELKKALKNEKNVSGAYFTLETILKNIALAKNNHLPICQDTGTPIFFVKYGPNYRQKYLKKAIETATKKATSLIPLRANAVDTFKGKNTGNNVADHIPVIYFEEMESKGLKIRLILKGGGSENIGMTFKLPDANLNAGRDLAGIKKCALNAVFQAQGKGCPPMIMSIAAGSPKDMLAVEGKRQLLRKLTEKNKNPKLFRAEKEITEMANSLGIGPGGLGGKTTLLGTFISFFGRHPASYFVDINFLCWAARRGEMVVEKNKVKFDR